jgi:hypothetical protein
MSAERHQNPHRPARRAPLLRRHPFRPAGFGGGLVLTMLGAVFLAHQLGRVELGPVATGAVMTVSAAVLLVAVAIGWARHGARAVSPPDTGRSQQD